MFEMRGEGRGNGRKRVTPLKKKKERFPLRNSFGRDVTARFISGTTGYKSVYFVDDYKYNSDVMGQNVEPRENYFER